MAQSPAGIFITLEGGEGAGKSTLAQTLEARFRAQDRTVLRTREPGGTPGADTIRALLVQGAQDRWTPLTELLLIAAARHDHITRAIGPALAGGSVVICDRFSDSTIAYQAGGGGLPRDAVDRVSALVAAPEPDLTLLLDIPPALGLSRSRGQSVGEDRFEAHDLFFHERVREAFLARAAEAPHRILTLDASEPPEALAQAALTAIRARLGPIV